MYLEISESCSAFSSSDSARLLDLAVLDLDLGVLLVEQARLLLQLERLLLERRVGALELVLLLRQLLRLRLQLLGQRLRLLQQLLGAHVGADHVEHDADATPSADRGTAGGSALNGVERRQLDDRLDLALEQHRQHDDVERRRLAEARS